MNAEGEPQAISENQGRVNRAAMVRRFLRVPFPFTIAIHAIYFFHGFGDRTMSLVAAFRYVSYLCSDFGARYFFELLGLSALLFAPYWGRIHLGRLSVAVTQAIFLVVGGIMIFMAYIAVHLIPIPS